MMSHAENVPADFTGCVVCGYKESLRFEQYKGKLTRHDWYERFNTSAKKSPSLYRWG